MSGTTSTESVDRQLQLAGERMPFAMLPRWLLYHSEVSEGAKFLYCVLHDLVSGRQGPTRPVTRAELAACCGVSVDTIDRRLAQLVAVRAVEKQAQIRAGGQQANVYQVWLTPPGGLHRTPVTDPGPGGRTAAAPVEGDANPQVSRSRVSAAPPVEPHGCGPARRAGAAPNEKEEDQEVPPQPPRRAGGHEMDRVQRVALESRPIPPDPVPRPLQSSPLDRDQVSARRRSRALGTNPRAEADRAEQSRLEAEADARRVELERATESRRAAERAAAAESDRLEAEALAVSAALDDSTLAAIVAAVRPAMSGPLAASAMAVARAVVAWCRTAAVSHDGDFAEAVAAGFTARFMVGEEPAAPPALPAAPPGTASLRARIAPLLKPVGEA